MGQLHVYKVGQNGEKNKGRCTREADIGRQEDKKRKRRWGKVSRKTTWGMRKIVRSGRGD